MNILDLLQEDGLWPKRVASTHGGEYASPCPGCGGRDRFRAWPSSGRWWCRQCGLSGDEIEYLRRFRGLSFSEACRVLGREPKIQSKAKGAKGRQTSARSSTPNLPPSVWMEKAELLINWAEKNLWSDQRAEALSFLRDRGLTDHTIKAARLGFNPKDIYRNRQDWSLEPKFKENGRAKKLWIPTGLVIPYVLDGQVVRVRFRRTSGEPPYILLSGSQTGPMILGDQRPCLVVESELDGLLMNQETGDLVTTIALGSAQVRPDKAISARLKKAGVILVALDSDEAGAKEAWGWWTKHYKKSKRWPLPGHKDPGEAVRHGFNLRQWVEAGLASDEKVQDEPAEFSENLPEPEPVSNSESEDGILGVSQAVWSELTRIMPSEMTRALEMTAEVFPDAKLVGFEKS